MTGGQLELRQIEGRRLTAQARFDAEREMAERNRHGQYATPPELAAEIVREAMRMAGAGPLRFGEPSVGTGAFYGALLQQGVALASAWGVERDPKLAEICASLWASRGLDVEEGDFTALSMPPVDLLVANPPYVRHHHLGKAEKARLRAVVEAQAGFRVHGLAGLYIYFMVLGTLSLAPGGLGVWLVPSEWLYVGYGAAFRRWLISTCRVERVHVFDAEDAQFGDALVSSAVVFVRRETPAPAVAFTRGVSLADPRSTHLIKAEALYDAPRWPPPPPREGPVLGDYFTIRRGVATGANDFFILTREEAAARGLPPEVLTPVLPSSRGLAAAIIDEPGDLVLLDCHDSEDPAVAAYLAEGEAAGLRQRYLLSRRRPWYRQEAREPAPFVCAYMGRKSPLRIFWNQARLAATNRWLLLYPRPGFSELACWEALQQIEPASAMERGRVYGGGLYKLEPRELASLPITPLRVDEDRGQTV